MGGGLVVTPALRCPTFNWQRDYPYPLTIKPDAPLGGMHTFLLQEVDPTNETIDRLRTSYSGSVTGGGSWATLEFSVG